MEALAWRQALDRAGSFRLDVERAARGLAGERRVEALRLALERARSIRRAEPFLKKSWDARIDAYKLAILIMDRPQFRARRPRTREDKWGHLFFMEPPWACALLSKTGPDNLQQARRAYARVYGERCKEVGLLDRAIKVMA